MGQCVSHHEESFGIQHLALPCMLVSERGIVQKANTPICELLGYDCIIGMNIKSFIPRDIAAHHDTYMARYQSTRTSNVIDHTGRFVNLVDSRGRTKECFLTVNSLDQGFIAFFQDMTEGLKKLVNSKGIAIHTTEYLIRYLNFEVREPLQGITMGLESLRDGIGELDQQLCDTLLQTCIKISTTFDRMNEFEAVLTDQYAYVYTKVDVCKLLDYTNYPDLVEMAGHKSMEIVMDIDPIFKNMFIQADKMLLTKAINYVTMYMCAKCNKFQTLAVKATCKQEHPNTVIMVQIQVSIEHKRTIKNNIRWWDENSIRNNLDSSDLNMVFVEKIVCAGHSGSIFHFRQPNTHGIQLCLATTLKQKPKFCETKLEDQVIGEMSPIAKIRPIRSPPIITQDYVDIVYIDDSYMLQKGFTFLAKKHDWSCQTFGGGKDAVEWFKTNSAKLILVDKVMHDMDGIETIEHLIKYNIPIIGITGDSHEKDNNQMVKSGAEQVFVKPITLHILKSLVEKYCT